MDDRRSGGNDGKGVVPRFSLRRLLFSSTLTAVGLGLAAYGAKLHSIVLNTDDDARPFWAMVSMIAWFGGGMFAGAGVFVPLRHPALVVLGAIVGLFVQVAWVVYLFGPQ